MTTQNFKRNLLLILYRQGNKNVCHLSLFPPAALERTKSLTLVVYFLCLGTSSLPACYSLKIKPVNPKRSQLWIFIGRTDSEVESPILCPPDVNSQLTEKDPVAGKDQEQEKKGETEDEMVRYHHQLNGHKFEQTPGDSRGQRSLVCCSPWGCKDSDTLSNWTAANFFAFFFGVLLHLLKFYPVPFAS